MLCSLLISILKTIVHVVPFLFILCSLQEYKVAMGLQHTQLEESAARATELAAELGSAHSQIQVIVMIFIYFVLFRLK